MGLAQQPDESILIVDDEEATCHLLASLLLEEGYEVRSAANGVEALAALRSNPKTDLILLDLMMPVMSGWEFRRCQKRDPALASIPVVIVSAASEVGQTAVALGAASYLHKPIEPNHLLATVRRLC